jgi:hypothetical protein
MLLCNNTHNLSFADAQLLAKFLCELFLKAILDCASKATHLMLRHAIDVEAESRTRYKALSKYFVLKIKGRVSEARVKPSDGYHFTLKASRGANRRRNPQKYCLSTGRRHTFPQRTMNGPGNSSASVLGIVKRLTEIVKETARSRIRAATGAAASPDHGAIRPCRGRELPRLLRRARARRRIRGGGGWRGYWREWDGYDP